MESFIKIGPFVWAVKITYTHRYAHRRTHTLASIPTYSVKMTEYKKSRKTCKSEARYRLNETRTRKCYNIFSHLFLFWRFRNQYHSLSQKNQVQNFAPAGDRTRDLRAWLRNQGSDFSRTRSAFSTRSYQPILLIFNTKQCKSYVLLVLKFEENRTKIATVRVPQRVSAKWPLWRHQIRNFKNREKWHSQIYSRSFV